MPPASGETYVICNECGARLWSEGGDEKYRGIACPYRQQDGECETPEERMRHG